MARIQTFFKRFNWLEILALVLMIVFLYPFIIVVLNASKDNIAITDNPIALPTDWLLFFRNVADIVGDPNLNYFRALFNSIIITTFSLGLIGVSSAMAAWVLVRPKRDFP